MTDLVTWLRAQLDDDERVARDVAVHGWHIQLRNASIQPGGPLADHIARWDPARVLAEVDAKRRILELHSPEPSHYVNGRYISAEPGDLQCAHCTELCHSRSGLGCDQPDAPWPCPTVRLVVLPYADRSGFDPLWAESMIR